MSDVRQSPIGTLPHAVVIGRNEGARLLSCLQSLRPQIDRLVYVDSGSTDGSVSLARAFGAEVVELDMSAPFTAARARNAGLAQLSDAPADGLVQLIDGDCWLMPGWLCRARAFLDANEDVAIVCGRRREVAPEASAYNRFTDQEWATPVGETRACGGDALCRLSALRQVGGFRANLIAGEEPEMCLRLRRGGWRIWRLEAEMTRHDAALLRFGQWWTRARRAGYAFAEGAALHGRAPEKHWVRETRRAVFWGLGLPALALACTTLHPLLGLFVLMAYPGQLLRLRWQLGRDTGLSGAVLLLVGKFAESLGVLQFHLNRLRRQRGRLISYK